MKRTAIAVLALLASCNPAFAQKAIVCPPHLSYCYEKPVLPRMTARDELAEFSAQLDRDLAAVQYRMWRTDASLDAALRRTQFCNSVRQDGC